MVVTQATWPGSSASTSPLAASRSSMIPPSAKTASVKPSGLRQASPRLSYSSIAKSSAPAAAPALTSHTRTPLMPCVASSRVPSALKVSACAATDSGTAPR